MSVYNIEGDLYWGNSTTPITHLSGESGRGILLANVPQRRAVLSIPARRKILRNGLGEDQIESLNLGHGMARITIPLRDVAASTLRLALRDMLSDSDTGVRSSGGNIGTRLRVAKTMQLAIIPLLNTEHMLYCPAAAIDDGQDLSFLWARDGEHTESQQIVLVPTRPFGQTTPAWMKDTPANVASVYSLTA